MRQRKSHELPASSRVSVVSVAHLMISISDSLPGEASESGIIFQPAEVEDVVIETVDETKGEGESDMPYSKPQFPALTPPLSCKKSFEDLLSVWLASSPD